MFRGSGFSSLRSGQLKLQHSEAVAKGAAIMLGSVTVGSDRSVCVWISGSAKTLCGKFPNAKLADYRKCLAPKLILTPGKHFHPDVHAVQQKYAMGSWQACLVQEADDSQYLRGRNTH